jgi:hypothetical protein
MCICMYVPTQYIHIYRYNACVYVICRPIYEKQTNLIGGNFEIQDGYKMAAFNIMKSTNCIVNGFIDLEYIGLAMPVGI